MRGRKPKPTELHILEGTHRDDRSLPDAARGETMITVPAPPAGLKKNKEAKALWFQLAAQLSDMRILTNADLVALEIYCQQVLIYRKATDMFWEDPQDYLVTREGSKGNQVTKMNEYAAVSTEAFRKIVIIGSELGLTPAARTKIGVRNSFKADPARGLIRK